MNSYCWRSVSWKIWRFAVGWWVAVPDEAGWFVCDFCRGLNLRIWRFGLTWLNAAAWDDYRDRMRILRGARR